MTVKRINKRTARKLFNEGKGFWIVPRFPRPTALGRPCKLQE